MSLHIHLLFLGLCCCSVLQLAAAVNSLPAGQWQYQLKEPFQYPRHVLPNVTVYGIDLFDTSAATVAAMKDAGLYPICYFSTQYENWRPDASNFTAHVLGNSLGSWAGEKWVDIRSPVVRAIAVQRMSACKDKGFLAVDPDNTDGYSNNPGFPLTVEDTLDFLTFLSQQAKAMGLGIGLKNTLDLISPTSVALWDFAVNEECYSNSFNDTDVECVLYAPFKSAGLPVFQVQYTDSADFHANVCPKISKYNTTSINKKMDLMSLPWEACNLTAKNSARRSVQQLWLVALGLLLFMQLL